VEDTGDERDQSEIDGSHGRGSSGVSQAALEMSPRPSGVADDGVAEASGMSTKLRTEVRIQERVASIHYKRHDVKEREGKLPARVPPVSISIAAGERRKALHESSCRKQALQPEIDAEIAQLDFIEQKARAEPRDKAETLKAVLTWKTSNAAPGP